MMGFFVLDGTSSSDFGVNVSGLESWKTPQREIEKVKIPGRSGHLITYVGGWENVEEEYPAWIARKFHHRWDRFAEWWNAHTDNYYELSDIYHPEYFRMACPISKLDPDVGTLNKSGKFDLKFDCKPQKYLRDGNVARIVPDGGSITLRNPTSYDAHPLVISKMAGGADNIIMISDDMDSVICQLRFKANDGTYSYAGTDIVYDSETQEATASFYTNLISANAAVVETFENDFSKFSIPADTTVRIDSWNGEFAIYPRWYRI